VTSWEMWQPQACSRTGSMRQNGEYGSCSKPPGSAAVKALPMREARAKQEPSKSQARAKQEPSKSQARAKQEPSKSQARAKQEPSKSGCLTSHWSKRFPSATRSRCNGLFVKQPRPDRRPVSRSLERTSVACGPMSAKAAKKEQTLPLLPTR
jgi:hypothetical protein